MNILKQFHYIKDEKLRNELIENYDEKEAKKSLKSVLYDKSFYENKLAYSILCGFEWHKAIKGDGDYWDNIYEKAKNNEIELFDKVECLEEGLHDLRKGKKYPLVYEYRSYYLIFDDAFEEIQFEKSNFKKVERKG